MERRSLPAAKFVSPCLLHVSSECKPAPIQCHSCFSLYASPYWPQFIYTDLTSPPVRLLSPSSLLRILDKNFLISLVCLHATVSQIGSIGFLCHYRLHSSSLFFSEICRTSLFLHKQMFWYLAIFYSELLFKC